MQRATSKSGEPSDAPVNAGQQLYTRRTILSENINRTRLLIEYEKRSKAQLSNGNRDDREDDEDHQDDDAEFFNSIIKKKIFKEETPEYRETYTSKRKTSRLDENFWNVMRNFKQNLKQRQERRTTSSPPRAFRKNEPKLDYPFNFIESGNENASSRLKQRPLDCCEINSTLRDIAQKGSASQRTFTQATAFSFSNDVTVSPVLPSSQDERLEKQIEEEEYYISENRLMDLCEQMDAQGPTTSFPRYPSPVLSSILSPYPQFDSQPK